VSELLSDGLPGVAISKAIQIGYPELKNQIAESCRIRSEEAFGRIEEALTSGD